MKNKLIIYGDRIYLREILLSDANSRYCRWMNDKEVNRYLESRFERWSEKKLRDYIRKVRRDPDYVFFAIMTKGGNSHIGNIKLGPINRTHKYSDMGVIIGEKSHWGKGFAAEAISMVVDFAFKKLDLHKLTAGAYANNLGSVKAFRKAGFSVEGVRKKQYLSGRERVDCIMLGIVRK